MKTLRIRLFKFAFLVSLIALASGCKPEIGDSCTYDADCTAEADRTCDNSQPNGYCLVITCTPGNCPDGSSCVEFISPSPDFDSDSATLTSLLYEQLEPNRARTYCLQRCKKDSTCRNGYHCALLDELATELNARIIDENSEERGICVPDSTVDTETDSDTGTDSDTVNSN